MDRRTRCEQSFYKPLYHFEATGQTLLIDETTDELLLQKRLRIYNEAVYAYLKRHPHPNLARVKSYWREDDNSLTVIQTWCSDTTGSHGAFSPRAPGGPRKSRAAAVAY